MTETPDTLTASQACAKLGVRAQTLYAYVSRGLIRTVQDAEDARKRRYIASDVANYADSKSRSRTHKAIAKSALDWGEAAVPSTISKIANGTLTYRGKNAIEFAQTATLEEAAERLADRKIHWKRPAHMRAPITDGHALARLLMIPAFWASRYSDHDPWHAPIAPLLYQMIQAISGIRGPSQDPAHSQLARAFGTPEREDIVRRALVLCADHEINASTFSARIAASAGATLPACILSGLATLGGTKHGGLTQVSLEWMRKAVERPAMAKNTEDPPGFHHPLYPDGDPRAAALLSACPPPPLWQPVFDIVRDTHGLHPSLDLALAALTEANKWPDHAGFAIFAIGRTAGWIAHASEQRSQGTLIRPRAY